MSNIPVLNVKPRGYYANNLPYYDFSCSYPNVSTLETGFVLKEEAFADARKWAKAYEAADVYGNMACVLGVTEKDGKFYGVVNYYHSNT